MKPFQMKLFLLTALFAALALLPLNLLAEDETNDCEEVSEQEPEPKKEQKTPLQQILEYQDYMNSHYNMTNCLKEVIVVMQPVLAEAELANAFVKNSEKKLSKKEFLKAWAGQYRTILTNGYGFRLTFQLRNNFLDVEKSVTVPKNIADYFTLQSSGNVKVKAFKCICDHKLPATLCLGLPEVSVELYFNTHDENGKPLITPRTRAIRLQSNAVNADFGSYNFSWWLPFKYQMRRPQAFAAICGSSVCRTFVAQHPKVYNGLVTDLEIAGDDSLAEELEAREKSQATDSKPKPLSPQEKSSLLLRSILGAIRTLL